MRACLIIAIMAVLWTVVTPISWWWSADQQGRRLSDDQQWEAAAALFTSRRQAGLAWYRAGNYTAAAQAWNGLNRPEDQFNRGNALVFAGKYESAIRSYQQALAQRPDWQAAKDNMAIATARAAALKTKGGEMTGGKLAADDITFTDTGGTNTAGDDTITAGGEAMNQAELQALWLRRLDTAPATFLRNKFHNQLQQRQQQQQKQKQKKATP